MHFSCQEREKKEKKLITRGNPTIISLHVPQHVEEGMTV
jgi:hypothetical protein